MGSIIVFFIIVYLIKKGMSQGGFGGISDIGKIFATICGIVLIISLISSPVFWILLFLAIIAFVIWIVQKTQSDKRSEKYGWNTEEYQRKYAESLQKFKSAFNASSMDRGDFRGMNETQRRAAELENERKAMARAKEETDAYMRSKYGDPSKVEDVDFREVSGENRSAKRDDYSYTSSAAGTATAASSRDARRTASKPLKSRILPRSVNRRKKIIASFSEKYNLLLTEEQIKRIADASYMSTAWKQEVEAMAMKYDAVYGWMRGDTAFLRAYLRAFTTQDVTSDFKQQMQIVMDSFEEVLQYSDSISTLSIDQRIEKINDKFLTHFDEPTFMIAYRYLETLGLKHQLDKTQLNRVDGTFDDLVSKYDRMSSESVDEGLRNVEAGMKGQAQG